MKLFVVAFALCLGAYASAQAPAADGAAAEPSVEYLPPVGDIEAAKLAEDGYRYKTVRRLKLRHRRDVSQEYLPPTDEGKPSQEYLPPTENVAAAAAEETKVADDGYRYKTVRKLKFRARHRRDVAEIAAPANDYLPPVEIELAPELKTILGDDGYRYRAVRRLKYRRHRRDAEAAAEEAVAADADMAAAANEYLPPAGADAADAAAAPAVDEEPKSAELAADGYRYKTVRRIRYRHRN